MSFVSTSSGPSVALETGLRLEGPYFTPAAPHRFKTVVCLVAGTGISGAIALAGAFDGKQQARSEAAGVTLCSSSKGECDRMPILDSVSNNLWERCVLIWTVREEHYVELPVLRSNGTPGFETHVHLSGKGKPRLDAYSCLKEIVLHDMVAKRQTGAEKLTNHDKMITDEELNGEGVWVYISGPNGFIDTAEMACKKIDGLQYYGARWDI